MELVLSPADRARLASMVRPLVESVSAGAGSVLGPRAAGRPYGEAIARRDSATNHARSFSRATARCRARRSCRRNRANRTQLAACQPGALSKTPNFEASPARMPKAQEQEAEPVPSRKRSVAFIRGAIPDGVTTSELALADRAQTDAVDFTPVAPGASVTEPNSVLPPKAGSLACPLVKDRTRRRIAH